MVLNFQIQKKQNKSKSLLYKTVEITNNNNNISYKTIKTMYNRLLDEGYDKNKIYVKVLNPQRYFTVKPKSENDYMTIKGMRDEFEDTLDNYYKNRVKDPSKFTNNFKHVVFGIYE